MSKIFNKGDKVVYTGIDQECWGDVGFVEKTLPSSPKPDNDDYMVKVCWEEKSYTSWVQAKHISTFSTSPIKMDSEVKKELNEIAEMIVSLAIRFESILEKLEIADFKEQVIVDSHSDSCICKNRRKP